MFKVIVAVMLIASVCFGETTRKERAQIIIGTILIVPLAIVLVTIPLANSGGEERTKTERPEIRPNE